MALQSPRSISDISKEAILEISPFYLPKNARFRISDGKVVNIFIKKDDESLSVVWLGRYLAMLHIWLQMFRPARVTLKLSNIFHFGNGRDVQWILHTTREDQKTTRFPIYNYGKWPEEKVAGIASKMEKTKQALYVSALARDAWNQEKKKETF